MNYCKAFLVCFIILHATGVLYARTARVLFVGNSYTYVNNLPQVVKDVAASAGDTLIYEMSASGSAAFYQHLDPTITSLTTLQKIRSGGWDYVVLQEQSQAPAYPPNLFYEWVYPYAKQLVDSVRFYNPCAEVIFYMTWGRKNGDPSMCNSSPSYPWYCSYYTMDSVLRERYMLMADSNKTSVSPVGPVWHYIRENYPGIELYDADESHPSPAGTYAGACSFYTAIFKKHANIISYDFSLPATDAENIRKAATMVAYDSSSYWNMGRYEIIADFTAHTNSTPTVSFTNTSKNAIQYNWNFGDGQTSAVTDPVHTYTLPGIYTVQLISTAANQCSDTFYNVINTEETGVENRSSVTFTIAPNPVSSKLYIRSGSFINEKCLIQILNSTGQLVYQQESDRIEIQSVDVSGITSGVYMLNIISTNKNSYSKRIIIL